MYNIALVDDHPEILEQLSAELKHSGQVSIAFTARNGQDFLAQMKVLPAEKYPKVVIMDIEMPVMTGIEAVRAGAAQFEGVQYIMFTVSDDDDKLFDAIQSGADGYLLKHESAAKVLESVKEVIERSGAPMSPSIARKILKQLAGTSSAKKNEALPAALSDREIDILKGMVAGLNYKQIADKVFLSPFTVRNHISKIYTKLHINSKAQAVKIALNNKWI